jgi:hypothetical protein
LTTRICELIQTAHINTPLPFRPLKRSDHPGYHRYYLHPEVFEAIFGRFSRPDESESFPEISTSTWVPVMILYHWMDAYRANAQWRPDHSSPGSGRPFTDSEEQDLSEHVRTHSLPHNAKNRYVYSGMDQPNS